MSIVIHDALRAYIDPLTEHEYEALERSLLTEGCRDALVCWGEVLIDGHNRYAICQKHQLPYKVVQNDHFANIEEVQLWMIDNHLARRSVSDFQRGMLALRKKEILSTRNQQQQSTSTEPALQESEQAVPVIKPTQSRQEIARVAGISSHAVVQIEKIQRAASPELVRAVRDGSISISAAAAIASLPTTEQQAAVAGGRKELQEVARQVREKNRVQRQQAKPKPETTVSDAESPPWETAATEDTAEPDVTTGYPAIRQQDVQQRLYELETENQRLKDEIERLRTALQQAQASSKPE
ncbi:hypothetical protein H8K47_14655 [Undibacterium sp. CY7W]|uniref:Plasmid replication/partition related protein n=1 Tax=Undibacterium rugosum TaxID=2762291 RepID=A0A923KZT7_9BURK|nr:hypothetical protein [Undibacterium rugosum]MBC3936605.1 hypothetical protein [Undibacterium rugosum]